MRVAMMVVGTRGDVQPQLVLARELLARGHEVVMGASPNVVDLARRAGVDAFPIGPDIGQVLTDRRGRQMLAAGRTMAFMRFLGQFLNEQAPAILEQAIEGLKRCDLLVAGIVDEGLGTCLAEAWHVPLVVLHPSPFRPTRAFPAWALTTRAGLPGRLNAASWGLFGRIWWAGNRATINAARARLGLPPTRTPTWTHTAVTGSTLVQAYSPTLVRGVETRDPLMPVVGYLTPDPAMRRDLGEAGLAPQLEKWLSAGEPPVYFGFGSMPVLDSRATLDIVHAVARSLGIRALVSADWALQVAASDGGSVRAVGSVDHEALLPRCVAAVHHGGAGTTAASLIAGLPTVVCSVLADQPFWGTRLQHLGVGAHLRYVDLDRPRLEAALRQVLTTDARTRAQALASQLAAEGSGVHRTADQVESALCR